MRKLLEVDGLCKYFTKGKQTVKAVDGINLYLDQGETLGLVGESGCGKSTTGRLILNLIKPTAGEIVFNGKTVQNLSRKEELEFRRNAQIIFQDCFASLSPRVKAGDSIVEILKIHGIGSNKKERWKIAKDIFEEVTLSEEQMRRYPHEFSGGQRQRIGIARALCLNPKMIVCDEPVSALDVSVQAQIINTMQEIQETRKLSYIFISHDLSVVKHISQRVAVMYLGQIVEMGTKQDFYQNPVHPYSQALLSAVPSTDPTAKKEKIMISSEVNFQQYKDGCRFCQRCWKAKDICKEITPELKEISLGHCVACHFAKK
ncbi:MAG: ABC transporter ATP-binding protein [Clostridia bacterium]